MAPKHDPHHNRAVALFDGTAQRQDDPPRTRESIIREIAQALEQAHQAGRDTERDEARYAALSECRLILRGFQQAVEARAITLDQELREINRRTGKVRELP